MVPYKRNKGYKRTPKHLPLTVDQWISIAFSIIDTIIGIVGLLK